MTALPAATAAHPPSYYAASAKFLKSYAPLAGETRADVCIVGGGYTGLSAALTLAEKGRSAVLLEARRIGFGASGRNGGQVGTGFRPDQGALEKRFGKERAHALWRIAEDAKAEIRTRVARHAIDCALKPGVLIAAWKPRHAAQLRAEAEHLRREYGYAQARYIERAEMPDHVASARYHGGLLDEGAAHLHPLNLALGLARAAELAGARIHEESPAIALEDNLVRTAHGAVRCDAVVIAGDAYLENLAPQLERHTFPVVTHVIATEPLSDAEARALIPGDIAVADTKFVIDYYRLSEDRRLIFGGGETYSPFRPRDAVAIARKPMLHVFPQLAAKRIEYIWSGKVGLTANRLPHAGRLAPNVYFAQGYSGQGVALSVMTGRMIAEAICGAPERFNLLSELNVPAWPFGRALRRPLLTLGMMAAGLMDRL